MLHVLIEVLKIFEETLAYISPPICLHCRTAIAEDGMLCGTCVASLQQSVTGEPSADHSHALFRLSGEVRSLVHALKYSGITKAAAYLVKHYGGTEFDFPGNWCWVPVPLHSARYRERGYNQSFYIAKAFAARWGHPIRTDILFRKGSSGSQTKLGRSERQWNASGHFAVNKKVPANILLVDDVFTTGATTRSCKRVLEQGGAQKVEILTIAYEEGGTDKNDDFELDSQIQMSRNGLLIGNGANG